MQMFENCSWTFPIQFDQIYNSVSCWKKYLCEISNLKQHLFSKVLNEKIFKNLKEKVIRSFNFKVLILKKFLLKPKY
jgi:hypothetical protein